jgi:pimeloyl-ACP methyl ester carboxylesterase
MNIPTLLTLSAATACMTVQAPAQDLRSSRRSISYHTVEIDGLKIFYREAGLADTPTVLMLHGFPSSSRMWEPLLPLLADKYHLIAPDYPGFGSSDAPSSSSFTYTFNNLANVVDQLTVKLGITSYVLFMQDYGGPVGFRLALAHPERVRAIIIQNAVSHEQGLSPLSRACEPQGQLHVPRSDAPATYRIQSAPLSLRSGHVDRRICFPVPSGPGRHSGHAVPRLPDQRCILSVLAKMAARSAAADPGRLGQI